MAGEDWGLVDAYDRLAAEMKRLQDECARRWTQIPPGQHQERERLMEEWDRRQGALERRRAELDRRAAEVMAALRSSMH
jgi:hypothetical protein